MKRPIFRRIRQPCRERVIESDSSNYANNIDIRLAENNVTSESLLYRLERAKALPSLVHSLTVCIWGIATLLYRN